MNNCLVKGVGRWNESTHTITLKCRSSQKYGIISGPVFTKEHLAPFVPVVHGDGREGLQEDSALFIRTDGLSRLSVEQGLLLCHVGGSRGFIKNALKGIT